MKYHVFKGLVVIIAFLAGYVIGWVESYYFKRKT